MERRKQERDAYQRWAKHLDLLSASAEEPRAEEYAGANHAAASPEAPSNGRASVGGEDGEEVGEGWGEGAQRSQGSIILTGAGEHAGENQHQHQHQRQHPHPHALAMPEEYPARHGGHAGMPQENTGGSVRRENTGQENTGLVRRENTGSLQEPPEPASPSLPPSHFSQPPVVLSWRLAAEDLQPSRVKSAEAPEEPPSPPYADRSHENLPAPPAEAPVATRPPPGGRATPPAAPAGALGSTNASRQRQAATAARRSASSASSGVSRERASGSPRVAASSRGATPSSAGSRVPRAWQAQRSPSTEAEEKKADPGTSRRAATPDGSFPAARASAALSRQDTREAALDATGLSPSPSPAAFSPVSFSPELASVSLGQGVLSGEWHAGAAAAGGRRRRSSSGAGRIPGEEDIVAMLKDIRAASSQEWGMSPPPSTLKRGGRERGPMEDLLLSDDTSRRNSASSSSMAKYSFSAVAAARTPPAAAPPKQGARGATVTPPMTPQRARSKQSAQRQSPPLAARRAAWSADSRVAKPGASGAAPDARGGSPPANTAKTPSPSPDGKKARPSPGGFAPVPPSREPLAVSPVSTVPKCRRTLYGKLLLALSGELLRDWRATCAARYRIRYAALQPRAAVIARLAATPPAAPAARPAVPDARLVDQAFRVWLFNAAALLCRKGVLLRILRRRVRPSTRGEKCGYFTTGVLLLRV
ncbi:hypothetical protein T484DRAFT_1795202 [Baffinella frigidus]|nr:hypothetical protein T484DRAFT_1795202 [Cryptophyta sp. CCMP2293]